MRQIKGLLDHNKETTTPCHTDSVHTKMKSPISSGNRVIERNREEISKAQRIEKRAGRKFQLAPCTTNAV